MSIQDVIRFLLPREAHFYEFLEKQATVAHEGAIALARFTEDDNHTAEAARVAVQKCEHEGDAIVHAMEEALAKTFVTPIDREDLQRLSSELDTVLDLTNGAIRACTMLGVEKATEPMKKLVKILVDCTHRIATVMPKLRKHEYGELVACTRELRKIEKDADTVYREAISFLFKDPAVDAKKLIREKTVLEDLENAIDQCDSIGDILANLAIKNG
jgi:predicted phosphate transport protein (TIGR00153 family)